MTIDKAIKELEYWHKMSVGGKEPEFTQAVQLGIEALKRIKAVRKTVGPQSVWLLPGETKK